MARRRTMNHENAEAMFSAARRGERDAISALWQAHRRWVAAILLAHKPREVDLEDLLQDVAMIFVKRLGDLRDDSALRPWLRTVAINAALASGRQVTRRRRATGVIREAMRVGRGREDDSGVDESARQLLHRAQQLPPKYREPLLLRCVRGMSYRQIGEVTGLPESTIETRIARGRRMLRELSEGAAMGEVNHG